MTINTSGRRHTTPLVAGALILAMTVASCSAPLAESEETASTVAPTATAPAVVTTTTAPTTTTTPVEGGEVADEITAEGDYLDLVPSAALGQLDAFAVGTLTQDEIDGLSWMREEEKLAHDVYVTLAGLWPIQAFENIARAETAHQESVMLLLERYAIPDAAADLGVGEFSIPEIQALYDDLVVRGSESQIAALEVGAYIEELDISDLRARKSESPDIDLVYQSLERGSENHLRAFTRILDRRGATYIPTVLSADDVNRIISAPNQGG